MEGIFTCSWVEPLFCVGVRRSLEHSDLYATPSQSDSRHLLDKFNRFECCQVISALTLATILPVSLGYYLVLHVTVADCIHLQGTGHRNLTGGHRVTLLGFGLH